MAATARAPAQPAASVDPPRPDGRAWQAWVSPAAGCTSILVGCAVLAGWTLGIESLKRIVPGLVAMNPLTALRFILAGTSLLLLRSLPHRPWAGRGPAIAIVVAGALRLLGCLHGPDLGLDQVLFRTELHTDADAVPNRVAPNTALNLVLLGSGLLLAGYPALRGRWWTPLPALCAGFVALLALLGYATGVRSLYGVVSFIPTSWTLRGKRWTSASSA